MAASSACHSISELHIRFFLLDFSARFFLLSHSFHFLFVNSHDKNNACDGCFAEILDCSECQNFIVNRSLQIQFKNFSLECASNFLIWRLPRTGCKEGQCCMKFKIILMITKIERWFKYPILYNTLAAEVCNILNLRNIFL